MKKFVDVMIHAQALQSTHYDALKAQVGTVETSLKEVNGQKDQNLFIEYNVRPHTNPIEWAFEPCPTHYDTVKAYYTYMIHTHSPHFPPGSRQR